MLSAACRVSWGPRDIKGKTSKIRQHPVGWRDCPEPGGVSPGLWLLGAVGLAVGSGWRTVLGWSEEMLDFQGTSYSAEPLARVTDWEGGESRFFQM